MLSLTISVGLMKQVDSDDVKSILKKVWSVIREIFVWRLAVRQKFGTAVFSVPVIIMLLVTLLVPHLVLIAVLIALIAGYRLSFERK